MADGDYEKIDVESLLGAADEHIAHSIVVLKKAGYVVAMLTNNGFTSKRRERSLVLKDVSLFDLVIESCRVGMRKPDAKIYQVHSIRLLEVIPNCS